MITNSRLTELQAAAAALLVHATGTYQKCTWRVDDLEEARHLCSLLDGEGATSHEAVDNYYVVGLVKHRIKTPLPDCSMEHLADSELLWQERYNEQHALATKLVAQLSRWQDAARLLNDSAIALRMQLGTDADRDSSYERARRAYRLADSGGRELPNETMPETPNQSDHV